MCEGGDIFNIIGFARPRKKIVVKLCWRCDGEVWEGRLGTWSSTGGCHCPSFSSSTRSWCIKDIKFYSNNHFSLFCCWTAGNLPDSIWSSLANGMFVTKLRPMIYQYEREPARIIFPTIIERQTYWCWEDPDKTQVSHWGPDWFRSAEVKWFRWYKWYRWYRWYKGQNWHKRYMWSKVKW